MCSRSERTKWNILFKWNFIKIESEEKFPSHTLHHFLARNEGTSESVYFNNSCLECLSKTSRPERFKRNKADTQSSRYHWGFIEYSLLCVRYTTFSFFPRWIINWNSNLSDFGFFIEQSNEVERHGEKWFTIVPKGNAIQIIKWMINAFGKILCINYARDSVASSSPESSEIWKIWLNQFWGRTQGGFEL